MIAVTVDLWNQRELALFGEFLSEIEKIRNAGPAEVIEVKREHDDTMPPPPYSPPEEPAIYRSTGAAPVATFERTPADMEEAIKAYGRAKGFPAARALLDEYVPGGKIGDVPAEKRAELYGRLTA